jgi:hypothetical protein
MIDSGAFILLKIRVSAEECPGQAEGRLTVLTKILGKSAATGCLNHFLRDMTNLMKVCGFCNPVHIPASGTGAECD